MYDRESTSSGGLPMTKWDRLFEPYLQYLKEERQLSVHTLDAYRRDLTAFIQYAKKEDLQEPAQLAPHHVQYYIGTLRQEGKAASTVQRHRAALHSFFQYIVKEGELAVNPALAIELPKPSKKEPMLLSVEQVEQLLAEPDPESVQGMRDRAMLETLYGTGVRISELIQMNIEDVHLQLGFVRLELNRKERIVPLGQEAIEALQLYLQHGRPEYARHADVDSELRETASHGQALFLNSRGQRITRQGFWKLLKKHAEVLSLPASLTPHTLRQSFAAHMLQNGADVRAVQEMLGHADPATTQRYAISPKKLSMKEVYTQAHPRARKST